MLSVPSTIAPNHRHGARVPAGLTRPARFIAFELVLWASLYFAYLAVRGIAIGSAAEARANASELVAFERAAGLFHEATVQRALDGFTGGLSVYYMLGFGPMVAATLVWLAVRRRDEYRVLRSALLVSIMIASIGYVAFPAMPPRLMPHLGIADTVGLSGGHDQGSFAGVRFNPYGAMPSMHVGWSLLIGIVGYRAARRRAVRALYAAHPFMMAVAVTATGNHYFVDSIVGVLVALSGLGLVRLVAARRAGRAPEAVIGASSAPAPAPVAVPALAAAALRLPAQHRPVPATAGGCRPALTPADTGCLPPRRPRTAAALVPELALRAGERRTPSREALAPC
jgi:hypothetical protein